MREQVKIVVFVPVSDADAVRKVAGEAGAGKIGNYTNCSFSSRGTGRFTPGEGARPTIGKERKLEEVEEERIEMVCSKDSVKEVVAAIKQAHPYEEVALDIFPLLTEF